MFNDICELTPDSACRRKQKMRRNTNELLVPMTGKCSWVPNPLKCIVLFLKNSFITFYQNVVRKGIKKQRRPSPKLEVGIKNGSKCLAGWLKWSCSAVQALLLCRAFKLNYIYEQNIIPR